MRHSRFQLSLRRQLTTVGGLYTARVEGRGKLSVPLRDKLRAVTRGVPHNTPIHSFVEVCADRNAGQSRRADAILYIPTVCLVYIEFKTIEQKGVTGSDPSVHHGQLIETYDNIMANLTCKVSQLPQDGEPLRMIPVYMLLVSRRYWTGRFLDDEVKEYHHQSLRHVREPKDPVVLVRMLRKMATVNVRMTGKKQTGVLTRLPE